MFPLGAIGFVYVRTRELLRIILWFGSFLMCFPTFILKARKPSILVTVERTAVNATKGPRLNIFMFVPSMIGLDALSIEFKCKCDNPNVINLQFWRLDTSSAKIGEVLSWGYLPSGKGMVYQCTSLEGKGIEGHFLYKILGDQKKHVCSFLSSGQT